MSGVKEKKFVRLPNFVFLDVSFPTAKNLSPAPTEARNNQATGRRGAQWRSQGAGLAIARQDISIRLYCTKCATLVTVLRRI